MTMLGASLVSSNQGTGRFDPDTRLGALEDTAGLRSARQLIKRAVQVSALLSGGQTA